MIKSGKQIKLKKFTKWLGGTVIYNFYKIRLHFLIDFL